MFNFKMVMSFNRQNIWMWYTILYRYKFKFNFFFVESQSGTNNFHCQKTIGLKHVNMSSHFFLHEIMTDDGI